MLRPVALTLALALGPAPMPAIAGGCGTAVLSQSASTAVSPGNSASCTLGSNHRDTSYFRAFSLGAFPAGFHACAVSVGIDVANAGDPATMQPITITMYANTGAAFPDGTRVVVGTTTVMVADQTATVLDIPVAGAVPAGAQLVAEVFLRSGVTANHSLVIGSNASGQSAPTYIQAADCGIPVPATAASLGFPNMHLVLTVAGSPPSLIFADGFEATGG